MGKAANDLAYDLWLTLLTKIGKTPNIYDNKIEFDYMNEHVVIEVKSFPHTATLL